MKEAGWGRGDGHWREAGDSGRYRAPGKVVERNRVIEFGNVRPVRPDCGRGRESICPHVGLDRGRQPAVPAAKPLFPARSAN